MKEFLSLREFMLLPNDHRICRLEAPHWLWFYDRAKASWEQFGDDGPPLGSIVTTLFAGHGGGPGCVRRFDGCCQRDDRYFALSREGDGTSLVERPTWWHEIVPGNIANLHWTDPKAIPWASVFST